MRKWRSIQQCKICKSKSDDSNDLKDSNRSNFVIKCSNTKCKTYFHINCAIEKSLILPLEFMTDYYGFGRKINEQYSKEIPFYCSIHNRHLYKAYQEFLEDMEKCLINSYPLKHKEIKTLSIPNVKEYTHDHTEEDCSFSNSKNEEIKEHVGNCDLFESSYACTKSTDLLFSENNYEQINQHRDDNNFNSFSFRNFEINKDNNCNYTGLNFFLEKSDKNNSNSNENSQQLLTTILPHKPNYQSDDSYFLNLNLPTFSSTQEYNFINIENNNLNLNIQCQDLSPNSGCEENKQNFNSISKSFYDFFNSDIEKIKSEGISNVTLTQLEDVKDFFVRILENYNMYNPALKKIYSTLKDGKII